VDRNAATGPGQLTLFDDTPHDEDAPRKRALLAGRPVEYTFQRRRRRTIGLRVSENGLSVAAPMRAPWREIEGFLREKADWILEKLDERAALGTPVTIFGETGELIPLHGHLVTLLVAQEKKRSVALADGELRIGAPEPAQRGAVRALLLAWLKARALEALAPRVAHYAARLSLPPPPLALSNARTQWGVCMASGRIRLSWRLVHLDPELADYVVAHEIAHLVELNHSDRFWALVEWLYPHWREARDRIEHDGARLPRI
jgi:predicted metal-dependent hydrolase